MYLPEIDNIPSPSDPSDRSDFDFVRAAVRRHVTAEDNRSLVHRELEEAIERRRAAAAEREREILTPTVLRGGDDLRREALLKCARERAQAYGSLRAALNHYCASVCVPP